MREGCATRLQVEVGLVALVTMGRGTVCLQVSDMDPMDPWAQGMVSLVTARKEAVHQVGADFLPPKRYLRGGAWPPVMRASWGMSFCLSGDRQGWSPLKGGAGLFRVTWEHGLLVCKLQGIRSERGKNGNTQFPGHHRGEDRSPDSM